jgi:hypothetical protein
MATVSVIKLKVRRGTDTERKLITLDNGELGYVTDISSRRLFVGDGVTKGGYPVGSKVYYGGSFSSPSTLATAQVGDLVFNSDDTSLYVLTGTDSSFFPNYSSPDAYTFVGPRVDFITLTRTSGVFSIKDSGVNENKIATTTFTNGITGGGGIKIGINYDNAKIVFSNSKLTVNESSLVLSAINAASLPTSNPGIGTKILWNDGGTVKVA